MRATIEKETNKGYGVSVYDNNGIKHKIGVLYDGEINGHLQDEYPDKVADRTDAENEYTAQARRYARYYVYREEGYQTVAPSKNPEVLTVVALAIAQLSPEEFEHHFGEYYQQFRSTVEDDVKPVVEVPESDVAGLTVYRQNVYLDVSLTDVLDSETAQSLADSLEQSDNTDAALDAIADALEGNVVEPSALRIGGVSEVGALYQTATGEETIDADDLHAGPPDARLELSPIDAPWEEYLPVEGFQLLVVHHLLCQVRDCYLSMGLEPPESVRVLGLGQYRQTVRNEHLDMYDPVHHTDTPVDGYRLPELGPHLDS